MKPIIAIAAIGLSLSMVAPVVTAPVAPVASTVVTLKLQLAEQSPERIEQLILAPLMASLQNVAGVTAIAGSSGHGRCSVEISFRDGATRNDLVLVDQALDHLQLDTRMTVLSRVSDLAQATRVSNNNDAFHEPVNEKR